MTEFAVALVVLVVFIGIPLLDLSVVPLRIALLQQQVAGIAKQLSVSERFSDAYLALAKNRDLKATAQKIGGVVIYRTAATMIVNSAQNSQNSFTAAKPGELPRDWLPDGQNCPCNYTLAVTVQAQISPMVLVNLGGAQIPGLSAPIASTATGSNAWENLGRDPRTGNYYVNE